MAYTIQLHVKNMTNINYVKNLLYDLAENNNCLMQYFQHEMEGIGHKIKKNTYIQSVSFESINNLMDFIKIIRSFIRNELKFVMIDTIFNDDAAYLVYDSRAKNREIGNGNLNDLERKMLLQL